MASTTEAVSLPARRAHASMETQRVRVALLLLAPALILLAAVAGYPLLRTIYLAFTQYNINTDAAPQWIGLDNFWAPDDQGNNFGLLADPQWWQAVLNTVKFTVASVALELVFGLGFALVLNSRIRIKGLLRTAILVPWAIPTVVSAQMWDWMLQDNLGVISQWGRTFGLLGPGQSFIANPNTALWAIIAVDVWKTTPFMALLLLAGLQSIPGELYEAAEVDGADPWTAFWRITLPLLRPAIMVALVFRTLDALRIFDLPYIMKGNAIETATMSIYARQQMIDSAQFGYGSAVSVMIILIIMIFVVAYVTALRTKP